MAQTFAVPDAWGGQLTVASTHEDLADRAGLSRLPSEWQVVDRVRLADVVIDHVIVGPNGIFAVSLDPDPTPAVVRHDGLYRDHVRVTGAVKSALAGAHALRRTVGPHSFAYPLLVSEVVGDRSHLDRLGVVQGNRIAEAIWSHPGLPMRRSTRIETVWALRSLAS